MSGDNDMFGFNKMTIRGAQKKPRKSAADILAEGYEKKMAVKKSNPRQKEKR